MRSLCIAGFVLGIICFSLTPLEASSVKVIRADLTGIDMEVNIDEAKMEEIQTQAGIFSLFTLSDESYTCDIGRPKLPVVRRVLAIPYESKVEIEIVTAHFEEHGLEEFGFLAPILPFQPPLAKIPGAVEVFQMEEQYYEQDRFLPAELVTVGESGMIRGNRIALLEINPVQYNPKSNRIRIYSEIKLRVHFIGSDWHATQEGLARYRSIPFERICRRSLLNYDFFQSQLRDLPPLPIGYLVIVADAYYPNIQPLVDWKHKKGFVTTVTKTSEIPGGPTAANIRAYIQSAYNNWEIPPTYVLLVGDVSTIPGFEGSSSHSVSDLDYTTMNPEDIFPDIQIGRFPAASSAHVNTMAEKVLDYERADWTQGYDWAQKAYFMASNDPLFHGIAEGTHEYCMALARENGMICDSLYAYYGSGTPVATAINSGRSMAIYSGHGSQTSWGGPGFGQSNINSLTNLDKYPLVASHACLTGDFEYGECFGETWLRADDKGAVAFWGASATTYWDPDDILQRRMFDELFDSSFTWLAGMMDEAKYDLWLYYGGGGMSTYYYQAYNLLGEPSMDLFTHVPMAMNVSYPAQFVIGQARFDVTVTGVAEALVCVYTQDFSTFETGYTDAFGNVTLYPEPTTPGTLYITVTAHNFDPHEGSVPIILPTGPYVLLQSYAIDDDNLGGSLGNESDVVNPGESIEMPIWVENVGVETAYGVSGTLSIPGGDPYVSITDNSEYFGDIAAGSSSLTPDDFDFTVSSDCPHGHIVNFLLTLDALNGSWTSNVNVTVSGVTISMIPDETSVPRGGTLSVTGSLYNHTNGLLRLDAWADVSLPNGNPYAGNPLVGPLSAPVPAHGTQSQHFNHLIPMHAPLGDYNYCGRTGTYPGSVLDENCFIFTVTP